MSPVHDVIVITDPRATTPLHGANVDRDMFPNLGSQSDLEIRRFTREPAILRLCAKTGVWKDPAIRPDTRTTEEGDMSRDSDSRPELDLGPDIREGPDDCVGRQNRSVFDTCGRVNVGQRLSSFR
jgi:hypothetical protein